MLDLKLIRGETEKVKAALARRKEVVDIDAIIEVDDKRRALLFEAEALKAKQNEVTKQIPVMKKEGKDTTAVFAEMKEISEKIKELDAKVREVEDELNRMMLTIPNIPSDDVPDGDTDEDNVEIRKFGEPKDFGFEPKAHWDLGKDLGILDPDTAAKITGTRFTVYKDIGARLERAVINYYLDTHTEKHGYTEVFPPFMVHRNSMIGTGQLPKFEEDAFKVAGTDYFLVPTAEVPVTNMYREQILDGKELHIKHFAYTACFRAEAG
ncbi:MAG: serine--tRNA ligase, partial [Clostridia bacterium]|nr:serine--tRNA ligase [Clostridia bacterium]